MFPCISNGYTRLSNDRSALFFHRTILARIFLLFLYFCFAFLLLSNADQGNTYWISSNQTNRIHVGGRHHQAHCRCSGLLLFSPIYSIVFTKKKKKTVAQYKQNKEWRSRISIISASHLPRRSPEDFDVGDDRFQSLPSRGPKRSTNALIDSRSMRHTYR